MMFKQIMNVFSFPYMLQYLPCISKTMNKQNLQFLNFYSFYFTWATESSALVVIRLSYAVKKLEIEKIHNFDACTSMKSQ